MNINSVIEQLRDPRFLLGILLGAILIYIILGNKQKFMPSEHNLLYTKYGEEQN